MWASTGPCPSAQVREQWLARKLGEALAQEPLPPPPGPTLQQEQEPLLPPLEQEPERTPQWQQQPFRLAVTDRDLFSTG